MLSTWSGETIRKPFASYIDFNIDCQQEYLRLRNQSFFHWPPQWFCRFFALKPLNLSASWVLSLAARQKKSPELYFYAFRRYFASRVNFVIIQWRVLPTVTECQRDIAATQQENRETASIAKLREIMWKYRQKPSPKAEGFNIRKGLNCL